MVEMVIGVAPAWRQAAYAGNLLGVEQAAALDGIGRQQLIRHDINHPHQLLAARDAN